LRWLKHWWPALAWAAAISIFSTGAFTAENTGRIILPFLHWLLPSASPDTLDDVHYLIRKSGHFVEYFFLSLLILRGIRGERRGTRLTWAGIAVLLVAGYAALDEWHQSFVPGRGVDLSDVLLDTSAGIVAQAIAGLMLLWASVRQKTRRAKYRPQEMKPGG